MTKDNLPHCVQETMQAWRHNFRQIFNSLTGDEAHTEIHYTSEYTRDYYILNTPITFEEVESAVVQLEENKAPSLDKICPSILKNSRITHYLHNLLVVPLKYDIIIW